MLKAHKERIVSELAAELESADTLIVADYRGLTNKQLEALRDDMLEHGARFRIVKNTLTRRAAEQAGADGLLEMLEGPTAIAFVESSGDPAAVAKALAASAKQTSVLTLRGGIFEGAPLSGEKVMELATLPPMDVLRGQLVGAIVAPITQLVALVAAPLRDLHGLIDARIQQLEGQGQLVEPVSEPETADAEGASEAEELDTADSPAGSASAESAVQEDSADPSTSEPAVEQADSVEREDEEEQ